MATKYMRLWLHEAADWRMTSNGGDYNEGVTVEVVDGKTAGGRHWSSSDFDMCWGCGRYTTNPDCCDHYTGPTPETSPEEEWIEVPVDEWVNPVFLPLSEPKPETKQKSMPRLENEWQGIMRVGKLR